MPPFFVPACINTDMANAFQRLQTEFGQSLLDPRTDASRKWFMDKVKVMTGSINRDNIMSKQPLKGVSRVLPGMMYMFYYDPKGSKTLPYYDEFPLIILVDTMNDGMTGLNLHYLPIDLRQELFYGLLNRTSNKEFDEGTYLKITYDYLKATRSAKAFRPCFKKYLTSNIRGNIVNVPANEWEIAVHLPTHLFRKKNTAAVYRESRKIIENF